MKLAADGVGADVHHIRYGKTPWDVPDRYLQALCRSCHEHLLPHPKGGVYYLRRGERTSVRALWCPLCRGPVATGAASSNSRVLLSRCDRCDHIITPSKDDLELLYPP